MAPFLLLHAASLAQLASKKPRFVVLNSALLTQPGRRSSRLLGGCWAANNSTQFLRLATIKIARRGVSLPLSPAKRVARISPDLFEQIFSTEDSLALAPERMKSD